MANFLGAAFGFGARDVGLSAAMTSATKNLDKVNTLLDDQSKTAAKSKIGDLLKRMTQFNVASIADGIRGLTGETGNLSNGLESMAVSYSQAAKPIIASMDLTGKEAKKMTGRVVGMAIGLNTSAEAVAETFKAIHDAGEPAKKAIDAMGMSEKDWVKVTQTTGVTMQDFAGLMGDMVASWGASPEQAAKMTDNLMAIGKAAKIGTSAIKGAKQQLDAIDQIFEQLPPSMARSADEIQSLMESTYKLAGAFREMGETEEQATALGQDTAKMFAEQAVLVEKLYAVGGEGALDDSPLFKFLTQLGIGTEEARSIISEGSKDVVAGVSKINDIFVQMGGDAAPNVQYALGELNKAMGSSAAGLGWLASNTDTGTKALADMANMTVKGEGALKKYGDQAYSSGRTLQESLDLMKESFETRLRSIARKDVANFVKDLGGAYRDSAKNLKKMASDETWGPLVKRLSAVNQLGFKGLVMNLGGSNKEMAKFTVMTEIAGGALGTMANSMGPVITMLTHGGTLFATLGKLGGGLVGKLGLIGLAIGAVTIGMKLLSKSGLGITELFEKIGKIAIKGVKWFTDILKGIDWKAVGAKLGEFVWDVLTFIPRTIKSWVSGEEAAFESTGGQLIKALVEGLLEAIKGIGTALIEVAKAIKNGIVEAWENFSWEEFKDGVVELAGDISDWWGEVTSSSDFMEMELDVSSWFKDLGYDIEDGLSGLYNDLATGLDQAGDVLVKEGYESGKDFARGVADGAKTIEDYSSEMVEATAKVRDQQMDALTNWDREKVDTAFAEEMVFWGGKLTKLGAGIGDTLAGVTESAIDGAAPNVITAIQNYIGNMVESWRNSLEGLYIKMATWGRDIAENVRLMWMAATEPDEYEKLIKKREARIANQQVQSLKERLDDYAGRERKMTEIMAKRSKENSDWLAGELDKFGMGVMTPEEEQLTGRKKIKVEKRVAKEKKIREVEMPELAKDIKSAAQQQEMARVAMDKAKAEAQRIASEGGIVPTDIQNQINSLKNDLAAKTAAMKEVMKGAREQAEKWGLNKEETARMQSLLETVQEQAIQEVADEAKLQAMRDKTIKVAEDLKAFTEQNAAVLDEQNAAMATRAWEGAMAIVENETEGLNAGQQPVGDAAMNLADTIAGPLMASSPIKEGPLAGTRPFDSGYYVMEQFAYGISSATDMVRQAVSQTLDDAVILTFDEYAAKMKELSEKKSILAGIAKQMVRDFAGAEKLDLGAVNVAGEGTLDAKQTFEAALNVPGLGGVIAAIASDGHKTRVLLNKIYEDTHAIAESDLVKKTKVSGSGQVSILPS